MTLFDLARKVFGLTIALIPVFFLSSCYSGSKYSGDGQLIDNGSVAATDRYVLNLGPIDLTKQGAKTYRILNLPPANYVIGLEIKSSGGAPIDKTLINPTILIKLSDGQGHVIIEKTGLLTKWTWSTRNDNASWAFVYGQEGEPGTFFTAHSRAEYTLTFNLLEPLSGPSKFSADLMAKSGGWK